ncbi:MAG: hypothetical protein M3680_19235, partial [Myxococcota bacterium]|nr:hypothetical protein [Myxococcota bacterium]
MLLTIPRYRTLRDGLRADVGRAIAMATGGALAFAPVEYVVTAWTYAGTTSAASKLRLVALVATLSVILWFLLAGALVVTMGAARLVRARLAPHQAVGPGVFAHGPL